MRKRVALPLAASVIAAALLMPARHAGAVTVPGASGLPEAAQDLGSVQEARTVCRRWWNGYRWRTRCYYVPGHGYWGPRPWRHRHYRW